MGVVLWMHVYLLDIRLSLSHMRISIGWKRSGKAQTWLERSWWYRRHSNRFRSPCHKGRCRHPCRGQSATSMKLVTVTYAKCVRAITRLVFPISDIGFWTNCFVSFLSLCSALLLSFLVLSSTLLCFFPFLCSALLLSFLVLCFAPFLSCCSFPFLCSDLLLSFPEADDLHHSSKSISLIFLRFAAESYIFLCFGSNLKSNPVILWYINK